LIHTLLIVVVSYLLGSIPFGYLLVRIFRGEDVRQTGSGNIGATNVARTGSKGLAIATLLLDALKGYVAVAHVFHFASHHPGDVPDFGPHTVYVLAALAALCACQAIKRSTSSNPFLASGKSGLIFRIA